MAGLAELDDENAAVPPVPGPGRLPVRTLARRAGDPGRGRQMERRVPGACGKRWRPTTRRASGGRSNSPSSASRTGDPAVAAAAAEMEKKPNLDREILVELAQCYSQLAAGRPGD